MPSLNPNAALPVDVVLTAGQSNMSGTPGGSANPPSTKPGLVWEWRDATAPTFVQLADPTTTENPYKAQVGSCLPSFGNTFTAWSGRSLVVVRAARGGTALLEANAINPPLGNGHWDTSGLLFPASVTRLNNAIADIVADGHTVGKVFVIWSQGGRDAQGKQNLGAYEAANAALVQRWRTATGISTLQVFMEELSSIGKSDGTLGPNEGDLADEIALIRAAENSAASYTDGLHMAFNEGKDYVWRVGWMTSTDHIHYTQVGLNYMGTKMAEYAADYYGFSAPVEPETPPAGITSLVARRLMTKTPLPALPRDFAIGTTRWKVPFGYTAIAIEGVGPGGKGGNGAVGLKGGAAGGGAYSKKNTLAVTVGEEFDVAVTDGGTEIACTVTRVSDGTIVWRAAAGKNGVNGNPNGDGAGGLAADCIGDTKTSGQNGGVSGIDNGGNAAAPLGGAGGTYPPAGGNGNPGIFPGGGGSAAGAGAAQVGGAGARGLIRIAAA